RRPKCTSIGTTTRSSSPRSSSRRTWPCRMGRRRRSSMSSRKLAIVTGASSGIGLELAKCAARDGYDLIVAADTPFVDAAPALKDLGVDVQTIETDLGMQQVVDQLLTAGAGREVDVLLPNAGQGIARLFLDHWSLP